MTKIHAITGFNILLLVLQFLLATRFSTDGQVLSQLTTQTRLVLTRNLNLEKAIFTFSALTHVHSTAASTVLTPIQVDFVIPAHVASKH